MGSGDARFGERIPDAPPAADVHLLRLFPRRRSRVERFLLVGEEEGVLVEVEPVVLVVVVVDASSRRCDGRGRCAGARRGALSEYREHDRGEQQPGHVDTGTTPTTPGKAQASW